MQSRVKSLEAAHINIANVDMCSFKKIGWITSSQRDEFQSKTLTFDLLVKVPLQERKMIKLSQIDLCLLFKPFKNKKLNVYLNSTERFF